MLSGALIRARKYERDAMAGIPASLRPGYHMTANVGWLNDPNGFSVYRGEYHLFYQYHPYDTHWGPMHWGHAKSHDLIRWERLPCAMAPDEDYDRDGCFSGSALEMPDGRQLLLYTGVRKEDLPDGTLRESQVQCAALGDGLDYEKLPENPVIGANLLPEGGSTRDFRDPKLRFENRRYYVVAGNRCPDGSGAVLEFESSDARHWQYDGVVAASGNRRGRMWECPDRFELDGKDVLLVSPQEMLAEGLEFIEGNTTLCLIGTREDSRLVREHEQTIDYGLDFYAPQTLFTPDGRRVMIAWMQFWDSVNVQPDLPFFGQFTVPRELSVRDGRLIQSPARELENYRGEVRVFHGLTLQGRRTLPGVEGRCLDMVLRIRADSPFRLTVAADDARGTTVVFDPQSSTITVDRSRSGFGEGLVNTRTFAVRDRNGLLDLRVLLDRYSLELFANDGEQAASFTLYTPQDADGLYFTAESATLDAAVYELEF